MSSPRFEVQLALWVFQPIIHGTLAVLLYRRKLHKQFPWFFRFLIAELVIFAVEFPMDYHSKYYFAVYWIAAAVEIVLSFQIIHEIFLDVFRPYHALRDLGTALFKWAALIMVLVSVVLISMSPSSGDPVKGSILVVQRCVRVIQCGLVVFLLAFCKNLGVSWRRMSFGIALGFGILSGAELLTTALYSGSRVPPLIASVLDIAACDFGMLVWVFYSFINRPADLVPVLVPQRWDDALMDIQPPQAEGDSLIPMFEHMVDQALAKSHEPQHLS